jgi:glycosyltransferase involved in cell wall biosynthesis
MVPRLRERDKKYTKFDKIYANSRYTANLAKELYNMKAQVWYPQIDEVFYHTPISEQSLPYYVYVGRLVAFVKECDLIIRLFDKLQKSLIMIGS